MEGFRDYVLTGGAVVRLESDASWRGIQVQNPRRCRLNFYSDVAKTRRLFCMREFIPVWSMQNIAVSGAIYCEPIGIADGENIIITVNIF